MTIEYKAVHVGGVSEMKDEGNGVVTAYVSVTGVEDNVKDIIEPGAYTRTLKKRMPKGVWSHSWVTPTSKTLAVKELMPGDPDLPKELSDGSPWPKEAGALRIKMQFNLDTTRGREAYSDVQFFGNQQEWSIGYTVPSGAATKGADGVRRIKDLDLFEYSPVLFGANSHARTAMSVKEIQFDHMRENGVSALEIKSLEEQLSDFRAKHDLPEPVEGAGESFEGDGAMDIESALDESDDAILDIDDESEELTEEELDEIEAEDEEKDLLDRISASMSVKDIRAAYNALGNFLEVVQPDTSYQEFIELGTKALVEAKATGFDTIAAAVDAIDVSLDPSDAKDLRDAAQDLDSAFADNDEQRATDSATFLFDVLEKVMDDFPDDDLSLKTVARTVADKASGGEPSDEEEDDDWEDDDYEDESKSLTYISAIGVEYKRGPWAGRMFGGIVGGSDLDTKTRQEAFVSTLPNEALVALEYVVAETRGDVQIKQTVYDELNTRAYTGMLTPEDKMRMTPNGRGQHGRGGGRHRQAAEGRTPNSGGLNFGETGARKRPSASSLKRPNKAIKKPGSAPTKRVAGVRSTKKVVNRMAGGDRTEYKGDRGHTIKGTDSFPINNVAELKKAIQACGRAKDKEAARAHIKSRAKDLGREDLIPDQWKTVMVDTVEIKSLEAFVKGL